MHTLTSCTSSFFMYRLCIFLKISREIIIPFETRKVHVKKKRETARKGKRERERRVLVLENINHIVKKIRLRISFSTKQVCIYIFAYLTRFTRFFNDATARVIFRSRNHSPTREQERERQRAILQFRGVCLSCPAKTRGYLNRTPFRRASRRCKCCTTFRTLPRHKFRNASGS